MPSCGVLERTFQYLPLSAENEIRLLCIPRKTPESLSDDPINYLLYHIPLNEASEYVALSYSWGSPTTPCQITVNRQPLRITESLATALDSLRREDEDVVLFADAICINQSDAVEKTAQVRLMQQIYKTARQVVLWLGPSTAETTYTMQEIRRLGTELVQTGMWALAAGDIAKWDTEAHDDSQAARTKQNINGHCEPSSGESTE
ncbi:hypothetical protein BU26DRAFT_521631 [Trematosphaeria pertusa]|uniref:Heterokaryon incompatibility domain-containing protein n=1 Tax=Trematosphaeria pertusa TaxID=390896 RepID=A0A6A6I749_9PLEO|nr:uncharacterized protein BU26DRAFT_521631 [Trematosphaeria pertusa]KAF2246157.1 hypothetical protein BU26DRAFT_521631 [Trematosphaeria pertusa]